LISSRVTASLASAGTLHWKGSVEVSSSQMKNSFFFTRNGLFIFSHNSIPLATLLEWYKIRDTFFGHNFVSRTSLWLLSLLRLAIIQMLAGLLSLALERT
jgi:hypothetical protein